jgi:hypothetical protein
LALVGAAVYVSTSGKTAASSGPSFRNANLGETVQFDEAPASTYYVIEHTFPDDSKGPSSSPGDSKAWWAATSALTRDPEKMSAWKKAVKDAGFYNHAFLPTAPEGPFFCIWEAGPTKNTADMIKFINEAELSPSRTMRNNVMPIPLELIGGAPPAAFPSVFMVSHPPPSPTAPPPCKSSFYVVKHEFSSPPMIEAWWGGFKKMIGAGKLADYTEETKAKGFWNTAFLPTKPAGPAYCIWEAEEGKSKADFVEYMNNDARSPTNVFVKGAFVNDVMPIPAALTGGPPVKPVFVPPPVTK